jgi:O-antigen biosynthesis protein
MNASVVQVLPGGRVPYGTEALKAAMEAHSGILILGPPTDLPIPEARLADLLIGPYGIGAVVPARAGDGGELGGAWCRDVEVATPDWIAVRSGWVRLARIDPRESDYRSVVTAALEAVTSAGLRVVCEPLWMVDHDEPTDRFGASCPARAVSTVAVITGPAARGGPNSEDRAAHELIASLGAYAQHAEISVLLTERSGSATQPAAWRSQGVAVLEADVDSGYQTDRAWGSYSHIVITASGARSAARRWVDATQPQANKILFLSRLPFREIEALTPITPPAEWAGLKVVRAAAEAGVADLARWADSVWCEDRRDAAFLEGLLPEKTVVVIPPPIAQASDAETSVADRGGLVVVADEGHDVIAGNEDAALRVLRDVLAQIRWRDPHIECRLLTQRPTPMLVAAASAAGATLIPSAASIETMASARLVIAAHGYGTGQRRAIMNCLAAGTPFVATPQAIGGLDLGPLGPLAIRTGDADLAARAWQLLSDDADWSAFAVAAAQMVAERYSPDRRRAALWAALTSVGITPGRPSPRWPVAEESGSPRRPYWPARVDLRPPDTPPRAPLDTAQLTAERDRYQLWTHRFGPNPGVLRAIRDDLRLLRHRPRISVLMAVYNTDGLVLQNTIASVRGQVYGDWQLCLANDGSDRSETLEVLDSVRGAPSVAVIDLPGPSGIAAATKAALSLADGEFVAFLDQNGVLKPHALAQVARWLDANPLLDVVYSDEDKLDEHGELYDPHIKPDWSPDLLMTQNYLGHLTVVRRSLVEEVGGLRPEYDGSQDYDLVLRLAERTDRIGHIPEPLYSARAVAGSAAADAEADPCAVEADQRAVRDALIRRGYGSRVDTTPRKGCFRARYPVLGEPRVSIVIPTKNSVHLLRRCIDSVRGQSTYKNFEILIVDNQSTDAETLSYLVNGPWRVIRYPARFNYARMMNYAARSVECDALLFLNNDTEVITPDWIEGLLEHAMRPEVGAVGGRLYFGDGEPQHEGVMVGVGAGWAINVNHKGYRSRGELTRNVSAVTGACTMLRPSVYSQVGGNDERLRVEYNDVDLCLRIRQAGYQIVYTPFVELYHHESSSRKGQEYHEDGPLFGARWHPKELPDSYYSSMFDIERPFQIRN